MQAPQKRIFSREEFKLLREARSIIKEEFSENISLSAEDVLDRIYEYALESENEMLYEVFMQLNPNIDPDKPELIKESAEVPEQKKRMYRGAEVAAS